MILALNITSGRLPQDQPVPHGRREAAASQRLDNALPAGAGVPRQRDLTPPLASRSPQLRTSPHGLSETPRPGDLPTCCRCLRSPARMSEVVCTGRLRGGAGSSTSAVHSASSSNGFFSMTLGSSSSSTAFSVSGELLPIRGASASSSSGNTCRPWVLRGSCSQPRNTVGSLMQREITSCTGRHCPSSNPASAPGP